MCLHREQLLLPFLSRGEEEAARSFCTLTLLQRERVSFSAVESARLLIFLEKYLAMIIAWELETVFSNRFRRFHYPLKED